MGEARGCIPSGVTIQTGSLKYRSKGRELFSALLWLEGGLMIVQAQCGHSMLVYDMGDRPNLKSTLYSAGKFYELESKLSEVSEYESWVRELQRYPCELCGDRQDGRKTLRSNGR